MSHVFALIRLVAVAGVSLVLALCALGTVLLGMCTGARGQLLALRCRPHITSTWARAVLFIVGVEVVLPDSRPARAGLITSNHLTYVDIPLIASVFPCRFIAKKEIASWPFIGLITRSAGTLFLERGKSSDLMRMGEEVKKTLDAGISVVFFPEGVCSAGETVQPFFPGLLEVAVQESVECLPVCLHYETANKAVYPAATVCWSSDKPLLSHAWHLLRLGRITASIRWGSTPITATDRKDLARRLHEETLEMFTPIRKEEKNSPYGARTKSAE